MRIPVLCLAFGLGLPAAPALAQQADPAWEFNGTATALSDYVWRGVSQTRGKPALQLEFAASHASGVYVGASASNVDFTGPQDEDDGIRYELAPYVGWTGEVFGNGSQLDLSLSQVMYPGYKPGYKVDFTEVEARLTLPQGLYAGVAYSPDIFNLGGRGIYYNVGAELPLGDDGWAFKAQAGHYDLKKAAGDSYNDYLLGVSRDIGAFNVGLEFTGTSSYGEALSENLDEATMAKNRVTLRAAYSF